MNYALAETVLAVLSSPKPRQAAAQLGRFRERDWQHTMFWLDASGLALPLGHALRESSAEAVLPGSVASRLRRNCSDNARRTEAMRQEFASVNRALQEAWIRSAALKGFTLVPEYCADAALRLQVDLDYLVAPDQRDAAAEVARRLGYECVSRTPYEIRFTTRPGTLPEHADVYQPPASKTLEFHLRLVERPEMRLVSPDDVLERAQVKMCAGMPVRVLHAEDQFLHKALHVFQHVLAFSLRTSWLLEIARAVQARSGDQRFWEGLRERSRAWDARTGTIVGLVLALAREIFACEIPPALSAWTVEPCSPAILAWVRAYGRRWALRAFPGNKLSLLVTRELMDQKSWRAYAWASILPFHRPPRLATASVNGSREQANRAQRRYVATRVPFHAREAVRLGMAWPGWIWRRRSLG